MSNFAFLRSEWPTVHEAAARAEAAVHPDPRTACFYARRALELAVHWAYKHDPALRVPYQDNLSALIHDPTFKAAAGQAVFTKARVIVKLGNEAVHSHRPVRPYDALAAVRELFHVAYWLAHTYARGERPAPGLAFDPDALPTAAPAAAHTAEQLRALQARLHEKDESLAALVADHGAITRELEQLRAEVAAAKKEASARPDTHDYSEAETRDYFIDLLLREAGWPLDQPRDREFPVEGLPGGDGSGRVDYVLWGDDGKPLGIVEAKRTRSDARAGREQARRYADALEQRYGQRPVLFYSNGYEHWLWDDATYPPRRVQGFYDRDALELAIQRRTTRKPLRAAEVNADIAGRHYQTRAIRRIGEAFEQDRDRKALLVMATGAGKTRTAIALADVLMRCNWAKHVLFLADRKALVTQAANAFRRHLPDVTTVNLLEERDAGGRVYVSTYPTMMGLIDEAKDGKRRFGVGHFDLVVIDEAHRSVFQKYRAIFDYFDSLLLGLTATPKDEVDRNTYSLFDLESGVPTDAYTLDEAVDDGYLVPPRAVSVPLRFQREGIRYDQLSEEEKEQWDALEWDDETGEVPDRVEAAAVNQWLFNRDTVDKVLEHLMTRGQAVAGGDRLGKTIIFAKNQDHARYIAERFDANYPHHAGHFARPVTHETAGAEGLIENFSTAGKLPQIAISVDMLDTGIDVPEVVNLVFFKLVRSRTKFWQMLGRGTRQAPDLFGPGQDKEFFYVFDYCQNLEYFGQNPETTEGSVAAPLGKRLFTTRLALLDELDRRLPLSGDGDRAREPRAVYGDPTTDAELRWVLADQLHGEVAAMNVENFVVRPRRRLVEKYARRESWVELSESARGELAHEVAGLPSARADEGEEARRFDLLMLSLQLARLRAQPGQERLRDSVKAIAALLEEKSAIPSVAQQLPLIQEIQTAAWWQDVTVPMLEGARRRLRDLVRFIEKRRRRPIYTDFADELGPERTVGLTGAGTPDAYRRFRAKARAFLRRHQDHVAIVKLRTNRALTPSDLEELERMLAESGLGGPEEIGKARDEAHGLGLFVRTLVGLDRGAAKEALAGFVNAQPLSANQIEFVNLVVDHLTHHGVVEAERLYEAPFTDVTPQGPEALFSRDQLDELMRVLAQVRDSATAA